MPALKGKPVLSRRSRVALECVTCGLDYETHTYRQETSKFCSKKCWSIRSHRKCAACGVLFGSVGHYGKTYCSKKCSHAVMVGPNHPQWKDGKSLERNRGRQSGPLMRWKKAVKLRDIVCVKCGDDNYLHAHHIKSYAAHPELSIEISNGLTLCELCHSIEHGRWIGPKSRSHKWLKLTGNEAILEGTQEIFPYNKE